MLRVSAVDAHRLLHLALDEGGQRLRGERKEQGMAAYSPRSAHGPTGRRERAPDADLLALLRFRDVRAQPGHEASREAARRVHPGGPRARPSRLRLAAPPSGPDVVRSRGGSRSLRTHLLRGVTRTGVRRHLRSHDHRGPGDRRRHAAAEPGRARRDRRTAAVARGRRLLPQPPLVAAAQGPHLLRGPVHRRPGRSGVRVAGAGGLNAPPRLAVESTRAQRRARSPSRDAGMTADQPTEEPPRKPP